MKKFEVIVNGRKHLTIATKLHTAIYNIMSYAEEKEQEHVEIIVNSLGTIKQTPCSICGTLFYNVNGGQVCPQNYKHKQESVPQ